MRKVKLRFAATLGALTLAGCGGSVGNGADKVGAVNPSCEGYPRTGANGVTVCELRQYNDLPASGRASIRTANGEILAQGQNRSTIGLLAYIYASGATEAAAQSTASQVVIHTDNNDFFATGSGAGCSVMVGPLCVAVGVSGGNWSVSFTAALPAQTDLATESVNGNSEIDDVAGAGNFESTNGLLYLGGLAGDVVASSTNGALDVDLTGSAWSGQGLDASTTNGSVVFRAPAAYSARFVLRSTNGSVRSEFSGTTRSGSDAQIDETVGQGGATLQGSSTNGDVSLLKKN